MRELSCHIRKGIVVAANLRHINAVTAVALPLTYSHIAVGSGEIELAPHCHVECHAVGFIPVWGNACNLAGVVIEAIDEARQQKQHRQRERQH